VTTSIPAQPAQEPLFEVDADLLERLMKRTKTGADISGRELTRLAGIASGTISNVLTGERPRLQGSTVAAICDVLGVELLVLCTPVQRLEPASARLTELSAA
jgi:DNA-binding Xre family transcriptional regulator